MILFVCSGNINRSPLAAAVAVKLGMKAESAGLKPNRRRFSAAMRRYAEERSYRLAGTHSQVVTTELVMRAHKIFAMNNVQVSKLRELFPSDKHEMLNLAGTLGMKGLPDPEFLIGSAKTRAYDFIVSAVTSLQRSR